MEHLVEALKLAEQDAKADHDKFQYESISKERAYWEDHIKRFGMSAEQAEAQPAQKPVYTQGPKPKGMVEEGNLDINNRKVLKNPDGTISTETSMSNQDEDGKEVLIPTVIDGVRYSAKDAWDHYKKTGENLGKFDTPEAADAYAKTLHQRGYTQEQKKAEDARNQTLEGFRWTEGAKGEKIINIQKDLSPEDDAYFKAHKNVGGKVTEGGVVIQNPYSSKKAQDAVIQNEAFRLRCTTRGPFLISR